jgi:hypothetical protein
MTHDELLALLKGYAEAAGLRMDRNCWFILSDVVELHKPEMRYDSKPFCSVCFTEGQPYEQADDVYYPCPTIQAIEKELT